jgi:hypothetical protein
METVMHPRFMIIAAAALLASAVAPAQPVKAPLPERSTTLNRSAPVILASADHIATPAQAPDGAQVKRPRAARVTTCRCGGGDPQPDEQQEEQ